MWQVMWPVKRLDTTFKCEALLFLWKASGIPNLEIFLFLPELKVLINIFKPQPLRDFVYNTKTCSFPQKLSRKLVMISSTELKR